LRSGRAGGQSVFFASELFAHCVAQLRRTRCDVPLAALPRRHDGPNSKPRHVSQKAILTEAPPTRLPARVRIPSPQYIPSGFLICLHKNGPWYVLAIWRRAQQILKLCQARRKGQRAYVYCGTPLRKTEGLPQSAARLTGNLALHLFTAGWKQGTTRRTAERRFQTKKTGPDPSWRRVAFLAWESTNRTCRWVAMALHRNLAQRSI